MAINKISGTTLPTFKFRSGGGIELISAAIKNADGQVVAKQFKVKELVYNENGDSEEKIRDVAYYDTVIESSDIRKIKYQNNSITLITNDGEEILLDKVINKADIILPETITNKGIVLFGEKTENGTELLDSGLTIIDEISNDEDNFPDLTKGVPTANVVKRFVEGVAEPALERTAGNNVNKIK